MNIKVIIISLFLITSIHIILVKVIEIMNKNELYENGKISPIKNINQKKNIELPKQVTSNDNNDNNDKCDDDLKNDLLNYIASKRDKLILDPSENLLQKDDVKYENEPGYVQFDKNIQVPKFNNNLSNRDNVTLKNSTYDSQSKSRIYYSNAYNSFKTIQNDNWKYKNEKMINGGVNDGLLAYDSNECQFAAL